MSNVVEWRSAGTPARYPFQENSLLQAVGGWQLPIDLLCDAQICTRVLGTPWISAVTPAPTQAGMLITISDTLGVLGTATLVQGTPVTTIVGQGGEYRGVLVLGTGGVVPIPQSYTFEPPAASFSNHVLYTLPSQCMTGIVINGTAVYGRVYLVEGDGIQVVKTAANAFRVDAIGSPVYQPDGCYPGGHAITSIQVIVDGGATTVVAPDDYGNISIMPYPLSAPGSDSSPRQILNIQAGAGVLTFGLNN